jgi:predicted DNA-binding protein
MPTTLRLTETVSFPYAYWVAELIEPKIERGMTENALFDDLLECHGAGDYQ